jgi:hypothetical protein
MLSASAIMRFSWGSPSSRPSKGQSFALGWPGHNQLQLQRHGQAWLLTRTPPEAACPVARHAPCPEGGTPLAGTGSIIRQAHATAAATLDSDDDSDGETDVASSDGSGSKLVLRVVLPSSPARLRTAACEATDLAVMLLSPYHGPKNQR